VNNLGSLLISGVACNAYMLVMWQLFDAGLIDHANVVKLLPIAKGAKWAFL